MQSQCALQLQRAIEDECYSCDVINSYDKDGNPCDKCSLSILCADEYPEWFIDSWSNQSNNDHGNKYFDQHKDQDHLPLYYGTLTQQQIKLWEEGIKRYVSEIHGEKISIKIMYEPEDIKSKSYKEIYSILDSSFGIQVAASRCGSYVIYEGINLR